MALRPPPTIESPELRRLRIMRDEVAAGAPNDRIAGPSHPTPIRRRDLVRKIEAAIDREIARMTPAPAPKPTNRLIAALPPAVVDEPAELAAAQAHLAHLEAEAAEGDAPVERASLTGDVEAIASAQARVAALPVLIRNARRKVAEAEEAWARACVAHNEALQGPLAAKAEKLEARIAGLRDELADVNGALAEVSSRLAWVRREVAEARGRQAALDDEARRAARRANAARPTVKVA